MRRFGIALLAAAIFVAPSTAESESEVLTLYRNSPVDVTMRIHIATFDASDGKEYNAENCWLTADLFQKQNGVTVRYWCEPGWYKE